MAKTKKKEIQKQGLRPSQKAKAEKLRKKQEAKIKAEQEPTFVQESISETSNMQTVVQTPQATDNTNSTDDVSAVNVINVKNAEGEQDTVAEVLIQNNIDYTPKVSVVIPVYNVEPYLRQCLDSVINQTLKEIEIICVDDGSTDASLDILKEYAAKDNRITVITQKNAGSGKARNNAINNSKGEFIAFMDADDMYPIEKTLEHMYKAAIENNVLICGGSLSQLREGGKIVTDPKEFEEGYSFNKEGLMNYADYQFDYGYWRFIYNREFLKENQLYFPDYLRQQDPPFFVKTMATARKFYALMEPTYVYRISYKQISWNERKAVDVVKALTDILTYTNIYNLDKLHYITAQRLVNPWFLRAFKLLTEKDETRLFLEKLVASLDYKIIYKLDPNFSLTWFYKSLPNMCKVSVVIPVYNVEAYLCKCLDSVMNQTYKNIEIICVNDGSTDNSPEILSEYAQKDDRIKVVNRTNGGLSAARNTGITYCNSEFVYFLDSDDYISEDTIEILYNALIHDNSDVSTGGIECFGDEVRAASVQEWCNKWRKNGKYKFTADIRNDIFPTAWNKIYKMSIIHHFNIRFPEGLINEDEYWLWAYMIHCETYSVVNKSLYFYLQRTNSIMATRNNDTKIFDIIKIYNGIYETLLNTGNFYKYRDSFSNCLSVAIEDLITRLPIQMYALCKENIEKHRELFTCSSKIKEIDKNLEKLLTIDFIKDNAIKDKPSVSVIVPVYNVEANLAKCLDSIINQTLKNIEIICIDDGSKDASLDILKDYAQKDNRIAVLKQPNQRQGIARNNGIKYSTGEYIFFCDSDDWLELDCLEKIYNRITKDNSDICLYGMKTYDNQTGIFSLDDYRDMSAYRNVIGKIGTYRDIKDVLFSHFYPFDKLYRRELIINNNILFKNKIFFEDVIFCVKSMVLARSISFLDENLYLYRDNQASSTMGSSKSIDRSEDVFCYLQEVHDFLIAEKKYSELEKEYLDFAMQQITYHIDRVHDTNIKCNFVRKTIFFIAKNKLQYKKEELAKIYQIVNSLQENNKVLVIEINDCHGECLPGYIKYLQDLGYDVDAIINEKQKNEQPLCVFNNVSISYVPEDEILNFLNSDAMKMYKVCLFNSNVVYNQKGKSIFELFNSHNAQTKFLCIEHRLENIPTLSQKAICLILKMFKKTRLAFEVNPHYFGENQLHDRNKIVNFIVVGNIEGRRKNYGILMDAITELHRRDISNFKITVVGKGNVLDIPESIRSYFDIKGRLSYPDMYSEMQNADYFLPLLDPTSSEHERYIKTGTSGSFQLIYGFKIPCLIADKFARVHGFNSQNSIIYHNNRELAEAMLSAIEQAPIAYKEMQKELYVYAETLYQKSLDNFKLAIEAKVSKRNSYYSYVLFPYYCIKTMILRKKLLKYCVNAMKERLSEYRIDIRNYGREENNIDATAEDVAISNITWEKKIGQGKYLQGNTLSNKIVIKAINDGVLKLEFKGKDQKFDNKRFPVWIDYKSVKIDGKEILSAPVATWHDKPYRYEIPVRDGQEITLEFKQQYHEYFEDELKDTLLKLNSNSNYEYIRKNIRDIINILKKELPVVDNETRQARKIVQYTSDIISLLTSFRIDIRNLGSENNDIKIDAKDVTVNNITWDTNLGQGKYMQGNTLSNKITIKAINDGVLKLEFKGKDQKFEDKRFPVWIDYKSIKVDGKEILSAPIATWHNKPYHYEIPVKDGQEIILEVEQQYHEYTQRELEDLLPKLTIGNEYLNNNIDKVINQLGKHFSITEEKTNYFISLGENCFVRTVLTRNKLKPTKAGGELSYPFDLCVSSLPQTEYIIRTLFSDYFDGLKFDEEKGMFVNDRLALSYNHDTDCATEQDLINRYRNRINNFLSLKSREELVFVFSSVNPNLDYKSVNSLYLAVLSAFKNTKISFIFVDISKEKIQNSEKLLKEIHYKNIPNPYPHYWGEWFKDEFYNSPTGKDFENKVCNFIINVSKDKKSFHQYSCIKHYIRKLKSVCEFSTCNRDIRIIGEPENLEQKISDILSLLTSYRLDIKNFGTEANNIDVFYENGSVLDAKWLIDEHGAGKIIQGSHLLNTIKVKAVNDGILKLDFRGQDRRFDGKRFPVWIDYKSIKVDGKEILSIPVATWHDSPYHYEMPVKDGQEVIIDVEQQYHQYTEDNLKDILLKLSINDVYIQNHIDKIIEGVKTVVPTKLSKNLFNIDEEFFVITSDNLNDIQTKLYGYIIQSGVIIEQSNINILNNKEIDGCGCYVYIYRNENNITIKQDVNGSYGLYLFKKNNYFALSNSFFYLLDFLKSKFDLTFNKDYTNYMVTMELCNESCKSTPIKEIEVLEKNAVVNVNTLQKKMSVDYIDYEEKKYYIDSEIGMKILDSWFIRWIRLFNYIKASTNNILITLSGGIDSRLTFLLALKSGINLNDIRVFSINDELHTHKEDYEIATEIAKYYDFELNKNNFLLGGVENYTIEDIFNISIYNRYAFHKEITYKFQKPKNKCYSVLGFGGESLRSHWNYSLNERSRICLNRINDLSKYSYDELKKSFIKIENENYEIISKRYGISKEDNSKMLQYLYMNGRSRNHFGKNIVEDYFTNWYAISPLLDPQIGKLKITDAHSDDDNLLISVIFSRYCPELLNFRFDSGRSIDKKTIELAQRINNKYPFDNDLIKQNVDKDIPILVSTTNNNVINQNDKVPANFPNEFLMSIYNSDQLHSLITTMFGEEIYSFAKNRFYHKKYYPMREIYPLINSALVLNAIESKSKSHDNYQYLLGLSKNIKDKSVQEGKNKDSIDNIMQELKQTFPAIDKESYKKQQMEEKLNEVLQTLTSYRLDIKNFGSAKNNIEISAESSNIIEPKWFSDAQDVGKIIQGNEMINNIKLKVVNDGILQIDFRGQDRRFDGKRFPVWIDYKSIKVDGKEILSIPVATWHDKPFRYEMPVKDGQEITIGVEQQYHEYTEDELRDIIVKLNSDNDFVKENIDEIVTDILQTTAMKVSVALVDNLPHITADCFISIGEACRPARWLKEYGLRYCSLPFDWMMNFSLSTILSTMKSGISSWFNEYVEDESKIGKKRYVTDIKNKIISMHGFPIEKTVNEYMPEFKEIFARRYERMKDILETSKSVCFICNRNDDVYNFQLFLQEIAKMYPKLQIKLLNIRHSDIEQEIIKYEISSNVIFYDIKTNDIHANGNDRSNPKFWIGNENLWNEICSHLSLSDKIKGKLKEENRIIERKTIKIDFCDFWAGYDKLNNRFTNVLKKYYNIEISTNPDFLFYSCFGMEHLNYKNCVKIFFTGENVLPDFNECDYSTGFDYIDFGDRYFRYAYSVSKKICDRNKIDESFFNRKFCNFIYSNTTSGEGAILRQEFCKKLMEYKHIDCPGKVLNNMSAEDLEPRNGDWQKSKLEFLKKYKFTIAFENSLSNGYTTEKLVHPLQACSIPIYYGNPLVVRDFNPKAFINCNDYDNDFDAVIEKIKELDNDPDKYLAMLRENPMQPDFGFDRDDKYEQWLINIIEKGNKPFNSDPRGWGMAARLSKKLSEKQAEKNSL